VSSAIDIYKRVRSGELARFPFGFWSPPQGFTRAIELVRFAAAEDGIHPSTVTLDDMKRWGLHSPYVMLFKNRTSDLQRLASAGVPAPPEELGEESGESQSAKRKRTRLSNAVMSEVWMRDQGQCVLCGSQEDLQFDHIVPFSKGGSSEATNLRVLCASCNQKRGARI
jgi:hypothetical protein